MTIITKTFELEKKGRKYWEVKVIGRHAEYSGKLVHNEVTMSFAPGITVTLPVIDRTERSKFGSRVLFEPVTAAQIQAEREREAADQRRRDAERWLGYAEGDAVGDKSYKSNAVLKALELAPAYPHLAERLTALRARVAKNEQYWAEVKRVEERKRAERFRELSGRRILFPFSNAPPLGEPVRHGNRILVFEEEGKPFEINENHPSYEGEHLLGCEGERGAYYYFRPANEAETAALEAAERQRAETHAAERRRQGRRALIARHIIATGEFPQGIQPDGVRLCDTQNIYGGGKWFVVSTEWIWSILNNGADGDDWSRNNVLTGGAGAIGHRIPYDPAIAEELWALDQGLDGPEAELQPKREPEPEPEATTDIRYVTEPDEPGRAGEGRAGKALSGAERQKLFRQRRKQEMERLRKTTEPVETPSKAFALQVLDKAIEQMADNDNDRAALYHSLLPRIAEVKPKRETKASAADLVLKWQEAHLEKSRGVSAMPRWKVQVGPFTCFVLDQRFTDAAGVDRGIGWVCHINVTDMDEGPKLIAYTRAGSREDAMAWGEEWVRQQYIAMSKLMGG